MLSAKLISPSGSEILSWLEHSGVGFPVITLCVYGIEEMTAAELMEITILLREEAQRHFEYWLSISFAFIAATFIGRKLLVPKVATLVGALYVLTVALLISRYTVSGAAANNYLVLAIEKGAEPIGNSDMVIILRFSVFLFGTLLALWFLYVNCRDRDIDT